MNTGQVLAVIPARGGSTRVHRKNLQELGGRPLIDWTVEAAVRCRAVDRTVVSTEDPEIAAYTVRKSRQEPAAVYGSLGVVPQPLDSATSGTMSAPVVLAALDFLRDTEDYEPAYVVLLHPTSPFRTTTHIYDAVEQCREVNGLSVVSVTADDLNGALYVSQAERFRRNGTFFAPLIWPFTMDEVEGLDVDTYHDLERARGLA